MVINTKSSNKKKHLPELWLYMRQSRDYTYFGQPSGHTNNYRSYKRTTHFIDKWRVTQRLLATLVYQNNPDKMLPGKSMLQRLP